MLQLLELLMLKASSYTWKSVQGFYTHITKQFELCRLEFNDATQIRDAATISSNTLIYGIHCLRHALTFRLGADPLLAIPTLVL